MYHVGVPEFPERRRQTRKSSLRDDCHHVIRHHWDCHGMINASIRCLFSTIEEGCVGWHRGVARAGECIYMYTETANKHSADLNNVSPNRILQRCDVVALLLAARNLVRSNRFTRHSRAGGKFNTMWKNNISRKRIATITGRTCARAHSLDFVSLSSQIANYFTTVSRLKLKAGVRWLHRE